MRKSLFISALLLLSLSASAQRNDWEWVRFPFGTANGAHSCTAPDGKTWMATQYKDSADFSGVHFVHPGWHSVLAQYDANGQLLHAFEFLTGSFRLQALVQDAAGNLFVGGLVTTPILFNGQIIYSQGSSDQIVMCVSPDGSPRWVRTVGGKFDDGTYHRGITSLPGQTGIAFTMPVYDTVSLAGQTLAGKGLAILTGRFDADGNLIWFKRASSLSPYGVSSNGISADAQGNIYVGGRGVGYTDFGGFQLNLSGTVLIKYRLDGQVAWARGAGRGSSFATAADSRGNVYIATSGDAGDFGSFSVPSLDPNSSYILAKIDSNGVWQWASWGRCGFFGNSGLSVDGNDRVYMAGDYKDSLTVNGRTLLRRDSVGPAAYLVRFLPDGTVDWAESMRSGQPLEASGPGFDAEGNIYLSGDGVYRFGPYTTLPYAPTAFKNGAFLAKLRPRRLQISTAPAVGGGTIRISPNPGTGVFRLERDDAERELRIRVTDASGRLVKNCSVDVGQRSTLLDLSSYSSGLYYVQPEGREAQTLIIR
jgi:hypothetical protein